MDLVETSKQEHHDSVLNLTGHYLFDATITNGSSMLKKIITFGALFDFILTAYGISAYALMSTFSGSDFIFMGMLLLALGVYFLISIFNWLKTDETIERLGILIGLILAGLWTIELLTGNLGNPAVNWAYLLYRGSVIAVLFVSIGAYTQA